MTRLKPLSVPQSSAKSCNESHAAPRQGFGDIKRAKIYLGILEGRAFSGWFWRFVFHLCPLSGVSSDSPKRGWSISLNRTPPSHTKGGFR